MTQLQQTHRAELQQKDIQHMRAIHQLEERQRQREEEVRGELQQKVVLLLQKNSDISRLQSEIERLQVGTWSATNNYRITIKYYEMIFNLCLFLSGAPYKKVTNIIISLQRAGQHSGVGLMKKVRKLELYIHNTVQAHCYVYHLITWSFHERYT